jgi:hypothetical protein
MDSVSAKHFRANRLAFVMTPILRSICSITARHVKHADADVHAHGYGMVNQKQHKSTTKAQGIFSSVFASMHCLISGSRKMASFGFFNLFRASACA